MNRPIKPYQEIKNLLGASVSAWEALMGHIRYYYEMDEIWAEGNPAHKYYNTLYIKRSGKSLITFGLREGYFIVSITLGKQERDKFDAQCDMFGDAVRSQYNQTEILHDGMWFGFDVQDASLNDDLIRLMHIKRRPNRKILPNHINMCMHLDVGMSHAEITQCLIRDQR